MPKKSVFLPANLQTMRRFFLFVLLLGMMGVMLAQNRADSIHVHHYDIVLNITDFNTKIIYGHADLQVVSKVDDLQYVDLDLQRLEVVCFWWDIWFLRIKVWNYQQHKR